MRIKDSRPEQVSGANTGQWKHSASGEEQEALLRRYESLDETDAFNLR